MSDPAFATLFLQHLSDFARAQCGQRLVIGFSGGADSLALLHGLRCLQRRGVLRANLRAVHVHHGLSEKADTWVNFCRDFCAREEIPLDVAPVYVDRHSGEGVEAAARRARYAVFARYVGARVLLAHHQDDQAETLLFNLLRGAGVSGAAAMPAERLLNGEISLLRPLLGLSRAAIEAYLRTQQLGWIDDESNQDVNFRRNFLRQTVFPPLRSVFPAASANLARAARHFSEAASLLAQLAKIDWAACRAEPSGIFLAKLTALPTERALNLLRFVWRQGGFAMPNEAWWVELWRQLQGAQQAAEICVRTEAAAWRVYRGVVYCVSASLVSLAPPTSALRWQGEAVLLWAGQPLHFVRQQGQGLSCARLLRGITELRSRRGGERLCIAAARPRQRVRNLLQEAAVPPWERAYLPYLWCDETLIWVHGFASDPHFACAPDEEGILPVWAGASGEPHGAEYTF